MVSGALFISSHISMVSETLLMNTHLFMVSETLLNTFIFMVIEALLMSIYVFFDEWDTTKQYPHFYGERQYYWATLFYGKGTTISMEHYKLYNIKFFISCYLI